MSAYTDLSEWYEPHGEKFVTTKEVVWELGRLGSGVFVVVPVGYYFDVSVPRCLHWLLDPKTPEFLKAACLHDYLLERGWSRTSAAGPFSEALAAEGVARTTRLVMTLSVIAWRWK